MLVKARVSGWVMQYFDECPPNYRKTSACVGMCVYVIERERRREMYRCSCIGE